MARFDDSHLESLNEASYSVSYVDRLKSLFTTFDVESYAARPIRTYLVGYHHYLPTSCLYKVLLESPRRKKMVTRILDWVAFCLRKETTKGLIVKLQELQGYFMYQRPTGYLTYYKWIQEYINMLVLV